MTNTPEHWIISSLSDVAAINMGQSPDSRSYNGEGSGLPFFQGKAEFGKLYPTVRKWCTEPTKIAEAGDILLSVRAPVGPTNLAPDQCCVGRGLAAIRAVKPFSQLYLLYFFRWIEPWLTQQGAGTTFASIGGDFIRTLDVPVAPLNEQKRIADKLDALLEQVDACRERLERVPQILKDFRQAVLASATSGALTEEWRNSNGFEAEWTKVELGDVAESFSYGSSAKSAREGITPVLRMGNIQNGLLDWDNLVFTSNPTEIQKYRLHAGDVLFNRTNSPELVGKTAVFKGEREAIYAGYLIRIRCGNNLLPDYLNYCLNSPAGRDYCWQVKSDGVSQSNINAKKLAAFPINLPSLDEQHEIIRRVEILFVFADRLEARYIAGSKRIDQLIPSLLDKAFSGELTAEWREQNPDLISGDNSAEALRVRIKTEKTEADRTTKIHRKSAKTKTGKNMKPKMIVPVAVALKAAGTPLPAQELLAQSGYPSDATTEDLERFFLDIRDQLELGSILRKRSGVNDIFTLAN